MIKDNGSRLSGWVGSVFEVNQLMDDGGENFNNIAIMMRGRLAQEDILHSLGKGDVAVKYLIGEIHANYLDRDDEEDMATSGRQHLNQNDDRYQNVKESIRSLVTHICGDWHKLRTDRAKEDILGKNKDIKEWYDELSQDAQKITNRLFKYTATLDDSDRKRDIIRHFVPAVEQMRMRGNLDALSNVSLDNLEQFSELFRNQDEIEAMSYYTITEGRLEIINKLQKYVNEKQLEKIIQEHIYDHLWLLDPSWDRACAEQKLEKRVKRRWKELDDKTGKEVERIKELRIDIQYKKAPEQHVVIELKRPGRKLNHFDLAKQIREYMSAVSKELKDSGRKDNIVEGVIILGEFPIGWESPDEMETGKRTLQESGIRVTTYQEIISQAEKQYKEYIEAQEKASKQIQRIETIIKSINV